jgi:hypothetical protein
VKSVLFVAGAVHFFDRRIQKAFLGVDRGVEIEQSPWDMVLVLRPLNRMKLVFLILSSLVSLSVAAAPSCSGVFLPNLSDLSSQLSPKMAQQVRTYLDDTLQSLEKMRGANGLLQDTVFVRPENGKYEFQAVTPSTSPTNIGIDLLIQTEMVLQGTYSALAQKNISRILSTLARLDRHSSGLFFSWYGTDQKSSVTGPNVSSIDNMHLALALWTLKESFPGTLIAKKAEALLMPMDFSVFYDENSGLIGGNLTYTNKKRDGSRGGEWVKDTYNFANLGSEARILYSAGWALGLFKKYSNRTDFLSKAFQNLQLEVASTPQGKILKLWDGAAFQLLFPKIFVGEEKYSPVLKQMDLVAGEHMIAEGERRNLLAPAAHSPGVAVIQENGQGFSVFYNDKAGDKNLVSSDNKDVLDPAMNGRWDNIFAPYALFMAATSNPAEYLPTFENLQKIQSKEGALYSPGVGWLDGLNVSGPSQGHVVSAQLAVNQGMIGLSLLEMLSADGLSASARALYRNPRTRAEMQTFYRLFDQRSVSF